MTKSSLSLPDSVASVQDLIGLILEVREYTKWFSHNEILKRVHSKKTDKPLELSAGTKQLLQDWSRIQPLSVRSLDALVDTLNLYKNTAPLLTITLAAPPTNDIKQTLVNWCRKNIAPNVMVTFRFNSTILGGLVVQHGSRIFDWSFRRQLLAERALFPEVLRRV